MNKKERLNMAYSHLKSIGRVEKQEDVAIVMGSTKQNVSRALCGYSKALTDSFISRFAKAFGDVISRQWLFTGEGSMLVGDVREAEQEGQRVRGRVTYTNNEFKGEGMISLPLIPVDAMGGALTGDCASIMEYDCERFIVPTFRGADFLIRVQGDSMSPRYIPGDIVACKRIPSSNLWFQWGKAYVLDTIQGALIKRIEPSPTDGCITLHSENTNYAPFELPTREINAVALVVGTIRTE